MGCKRIPSSHRRVDQIQSVTLTLPATVTRYHPKNARSDQAAGFPARSHSRSAPADRPRIPTQATPSPDRQFVIFATPQPWCSVRHADRPSAPRPAAYPLLFRPLPLPESDKRSKPPRFRRATAESTKPWFEDTGSPAPALIKLVLTGVAHTKERKGKRNARINTAYSHSSPKTL